MFRGPGRDVRLERLGGLEYLVCRDEEVDAYPALLMPGTV